MNRMALTMAVMAFFVLALVGWLGGSTTFTCAVRALIGAGAVYFLTRFALKLLTNIVADAVVKTRMAQEQDKKGPASERGSG